ncbi:MAG: hypothetical protein IJX88_02855 [Clostridia bacterium]|nr:hypothetical protein [Clostridia bacterium]
MRMEEYIAFLSEKGEKETELLRLREGTPLGVDACGEAVLSQKREHVYNTRHTSVTGLRRTGFIRRLIITLSCLYDKNEANFFVVSPRAEYGELLRLRSLDITVPFVREKADLDAALACVKELVGAYAQGEGYPKLFLVLDGLEEVDGCNENGDFEEYRAFIEATARNKNVEIISGTELMKSIFSGNPGVFVGVGNCLVTTREEGKADVTYVGDDSSLSMPTALTFPDAPSIMETIIFINSLPVKTEENK